MYHYSGKVKRVIDGDTVIMDIDLGFGVVMADHSIRLIGIDTPEHRTKDAEEKVFGQLAKKALSRVLVAGEWYDISTFKDYADGDKFGRYLGEIFLPDGTNVNSWMVENNYAVRYNGGSKEAAVAAHLANRVVIKARGEV